MDIDIEIGVDLGRAQDHHIQAVHHRAAAAGAGIVHGGDLLVTGIGTDGLHSLQVKALHIHQIPETTFPQHVHHITGDAAKTEAAAEYEGSLPALFPGLFSKPSGETWDSTQLSKAKVSFKPAEPIVFALEPVPKPKQQDEPVDIEVTLIIRTKDGEPLAVSTETFSWNDMWKNKLFATCIDTVPSEVGSYILEMYFDGMLLKTASFQIAE